MSKPASCLRQSTAHRVFQVRRFLAMAILAQAVCLAVEPSQALGAGASPGLDEASLAALPDMPGNGLFVAAPPDAAEMPLGPADLRSRLVAIDAGYLAALVAAAPLRRAANGTLEGTRLIFTLDLFDDARLRVAKTAMSVNGLGRTVWLGLVLSPASGEVTLVFGDGAVTGDLRVGAQRFRIQPLADGLHRVIEYRPQALPHGRSTPPPLRNGGTRP
jgi:hypothetical protein